MHPGVEQVAVASPAGSDFTTRPLSGSNLHSAQPSPQQHEPSYTYPLIKPITGQMNSASNNAIPAATRKGSAKTSILKSPSAVRDSSAASKVVHAAGSFVRFERGSAQLGLLAGGAQRSV
jgi:hypothetical protein